MRAAGSNGVTACFRCRQWWGCKRCFSDDPSLCKEALPGWIVTPNHR